MQKSASYGNYGIFLEQRIKPPVGFEPEVEVPLMWQATTLPLDQTCHTSIWALSSIRFWMSWFVINVSFAEIHLINIKLVSKTDSPSLSNEFTYIVIINNFIKFINIYLIEDCFKNKAIGKQKKNWAFDSRMTKIVVKLQYANHFYNNWSCQSWILVSWHEI